jgi:glutaminyl-peptide cyclotransferase
MRLELLLTFDDTRTMASLFPVQQMTRSSVYFIAVAFALLFSCAPKKESVRQPEYTLIPYVIFKIFPHDTEAFTQGLVVANGKLIESTGQYGSSWVAEVEIGSGQQNKKVMLDKKYFGEGITVLNNKVYQLTWKNKTGFIYDFKTYSQLGEFTYDHEGWGITHNNEHLIVSDGSDKLYFWDTLTLETKKVLKVTENGKPVNQLNELEYIEGYIYANQWQTNYIIKINPADGVVAGRLDLSKVAEAVYPGNPNADVLNGIAYEPRSKMILVTGKLWPAMVAIKLKEEAEIKQP